MTTTQKAAAGAAALGTAAILLTSTGGPQSLPLVTDLSSVTLGPALTYDWSDGAGGDVSYGAGALGVSEDGDYLYIACNAANSRRGIAKFRIPQNGGRMTVAEPCSGPTEADIQKVVPGWGAGQALIGGVVEVGGRVCVAVFGSYDANGAAVASHFCGPNLRSLTGPFGGTVAPGLVMGDMGVIPAEWRAELGGSAFSMSKYTSIISRQSVGAAFTAFDPAQVTANGFPMRMLLGCPYPVPKCQTWTAWGPSSDGIEGAEQSGGGFILPGTRTFVAIEREATGWPAPGTTGPNMEGYGYRTDDPALHGTPYPSPEGVRWIYAPSDPAGIKGNKGTRYRLVAKLYDVARFGHEKPEDITQYATIDLPGPALAQAGAYNAVRGEFYLAAGSGGGVNTISVLRGWGASGPPPPPVDQDCAGDWSAWTRVAGSESACVNGQRTYQETRTFTVTTPASGHGAACPASPETQTGSEACQMPPAPITCTVTGRPAPYANGDIRRTIRCNTKDPNALPVGTVLRP